MKDTRKCFICMLLYASAALSQHGKSPYNPADSIENFSFKPMILPYLFGNAGGLEYYAGVEYGFLKHHSIGIDLNYGSSHGAEDDVTDNNGVHHETGNDGRDRERAFFVNYQYYLNFSTWRQYGKVAPYVSSFYRYGEIVRSNDPLYTNSFLRQYEVQNSVGVLAGCLVGSGTDKLWFDFNIGPFYKWKNRHDDVVRDDVLEKRHEKFGNYGVRIGILLNWYFERKK